MQGPDMGALVWVASYPRSGNTWLRIFLHNVLRLSRCDEPADLNQLDEFSTWDISEHWYRPFLGKPTGEATKEEVAAVRPMAQRRIADSVDGLVFVKTHAALVKDRGTPTIDMTRTSGAVYIVRSPLDVAISYAKHVALPIDVAIGILNAPRYETPNGPHSVYEFYGSWSQNVTSWTRRPHRAILVLRYEDMLAQPLTCFAKVTEHLNIQASPEQIGQAAQLSSFGRLKEIESQNGFRERPPQSEAFFRAGGAGQWRQELDHGRVDRIVGAHAEVMETFGYLP